MHTAGTWAIGRAHFTPHFLASVTPKFSTASKQEKVRPDFPAGVLLWTDKVEDKLSQPPKYDTFYS